MKAFNYTGMGEQEEAMNKEWFDYDTQELLDSPKKREEVFAHMLRRLETDGHCRTVYHSLALALFGDDLED
jgi:hypothetical protein